MKIADAQIQMASTHAYAEKHEKHENFEFWVGERPVREMDNSPPPPGSNLVAAMVRREEQLNLSSEALSLAPAKAMVAPSGKKDDEDDHYLSFELNLIKLLVEEMTGRKIDIMRPEDFQPSEDEPMAVSGEGAPVAADGEQPAGWGMVYDYYESYHESESVSFSAQGLVKTADGKEISVDLSLSMSREFYSEQHISIRAGDALKDPLVINYAGNAAELTQRSFAFDLDADGRTDQIAFVRPGSGFLALDENEDGVINNGRELFGPSTGSGFSELSAHDEDSNGWIDESDSVYDRLRIWAKDGSGNDHLIGLGQAGVGAIYLGHIDTPFLLKDANNQLQGQVRDTGLFLREDGSSGTVQELDLVV